MLAHHAAAPVDEGLSGLALQAGVIPGIGIDDVHGHFGVDALGAQIEGGVARNNLGIGIGTHIAQLGIADLLGLHAGGDTGQVAALIDVGKAVMQVGQILCVGLGTGGMAELDVGILPGRHGHIVTEAKAGCEDDVAFPVDQVVEGVGAGIVFRDVVLGDDLVVGETQIGLHLFDALDHVVGVAHVALVADVDKAYLQLLLGYTGRLSPAASAGSRSFLTAAAGGQPYGQRTGQEHRQNPLFHTMFLLFTLVFARVSLCIL